MRVVSTTTPSKPRWIVGSLALIASSYFEIEDIFVELRVILVAQQFIKLRACLHLAEQRSLTAFLLERYEAALDCFHSQPQRCHWINDNVDAEIGKLFCRQQFTLSELGHVREQRNFDGLAEFFKLPFVRQRFGENRLRTRIDVSLRPPNRAVQTFGAARIRASHDEKIVVSPGGDGSTDFFGHRLRRQQRFVVEMTAA